MLPGVCYPLSDFRLQNQYAGAPANTIASPIDATAVARRSFTTSAAAARMNSTGVNGYPGTRKDAQRRTLPAQHDHRRSA
jgi:hypothetical protein